MNESAILDIELIIIPNNIIKCALINILIVIVLNYDTN